ncbi:hypothetical protein GUJ93_ZPchr0012g20440 [Zizania palustris]|uniref:Uncharacterized protein n=1 Tax=Zizania palustris TaxID=103762 RepID=A0A8J5WXV6_ZIZPA|nr:hypothetical protein GUJ93_ZPchr0012g20440 [Zizania palustris]
MAAKAEILELSNGRITAKIATWGATITSLIVPDAHGNLADLVLGFDTLEPYVPLATFVLALHLRLRAQLAPKPLSVLRAEALRDAEEGSVEEGFGPGLELELRPGPSGGGGGEACCEALGSEGSSVAVRQIRADFGELKASVSTEESIRRICEGRISEGIQLRVPKKMETILRPQPDKVVVFEAFFEAGLGLPVVDMLSEVLKA